MNIKDAYIHNGEAILKDIQVSGSKLQKLKAGKDANDAYLTWVDVLDFSSFGASGHNHDDRYLKLAGNGTTNPMTGTIYIKDVDGLIINSTNKTLNIWEVYGNSGAWTSQYGFNLQYYGAGSGNDNDLILWAHAQTAATHVEVFRVHQDGSFIFKAAPKVGTNTVYHAGNLTIKTLMGTTAIGDADEPVYWSGSAFVKAGAYPTKSSWNYDDVYLKDILLDTGNATDKNKSVSLTNTNVYLKLFKTVNGAESEDSKVKIYGDTNVSVTTDSNGDIKIIGTDSVNGLTVSNITTDADISVSGVHAYQGSGGTWEGTVTSMAYAAILAFGGYSRGWQLWAQRGTGSLTWRNGTNDQTGWNEERIILDSANYTTYTVKKDGTGASGTWGIDISGNAATATTATTATNLSAKPSIQAGTSDTSKVTITAGGKTSDEYIIPAATKLYSYTIAASTDLDTIKEFKYYTSSATSTCSSLVNGPEGRSNGEMWFLALPAGSTNYGQQLYYSRASTNWQLWTRTWANNSFSTWVQFIHSGNIGSQSVNYATSSGKVDHKLTFTGGVTGDWDGSADKTVAIPTKASWDYDDTYLKLSGNTTTNPVTGPIYIDGNGIFIRSSDSDKNIWEIVGDGTSWSAATGYGFYLQYHGAGSGNNNDLVLWSHNLTSTDIEVYRVHQDGSFIFKSAPSVNTNTIYHAGNLTISTLMGNSAIGDSDEPVYWSGSAFVKASAYPTKASWNYDDVYLKDVLLDTGNSTDKNKSVSLTNGNVYLKLFKTVNGSEAEDSKVKIYGDTNVTVTTDSNGDIKIIGSSSVTNAEQLGGVAASSYFKNRDYAYNSEWTGKFLWTIWDNHLYAADKRFNVTVTGTTATTFGALFDGCFEGGINITESTAVIHIKHKTTDGNVWTTGLPYGNFYLVFYNSDAENVTGRVYCNYSPQGTGWHDLTVTHIGHVWILSNGYYQLSDLEITITKPASSSSITLCQVLHQVTRSSGPSLAAVMSKYCNQVTDYNITANKFIGPLQGNADSATYTSNVGSAGTAGTNYVTAAKVIATCNWYDTMTGSDTDTVINRWSEIVAFVANFTETPDLATFLSNNYLAKSGGTMTGPLKWTDATALPEQTSPLYFVCIDAFNSGGTTKWASKANTLKALTGLTSTAIGDSDEPVYWDGSKFVKAGAYPTKASWNYDDKYVKLSSTEQTIESTISSFSKGIVEFYRSSGDHIAFITFSNKVNNAKRVLGSIGFYSGGVGKLQYRSADAKFYDIVNGSNITTYIVGTASTTLSTSEQTLLTIKSGESGSLASTTVKVKLPATDPYTSARTPTAHTHYATTYKDSRNDAMTPATAAAVNGVAIDFKTKANGVNAGSGSYCGVVTLDPYSDTSGGYPLQIGFNSGADSANTNEMYIRTVKDSNTWNAWRTVITSSNITTYINDCRNNIVDLRTNPQTFNPSYLKDIVFISEADYTTLVSNGSITKNSITHTYNASNWYVIEDKVPEYAENAGNAEYASVAGRANSAESADKVEWSGIQNKPLTATRWPGWSEVTDKPTWVTWSETSSTATYSLSNATWTQTITLPTTAGSYILKLVSGNSTLTGVFSIGASDNAKDEISLHLHGNGPRLYARTNGTKLELSRNIVTATNTSVTITYRRMI